MRSILPEDKIFAVAGFSTRGHAQDKYSIFFLYIKKEITLLLISDLFRQDYIEKNLYKY
jgi:hypothetical protein